MFTDGNIRASPRKPGRQRSVTPHFIDRRKTVKLFLDSAQIGEIRQALEAWNIDGLTTNPRHIKNAGKPFFALLDEIAGLFDGTDKPVSVEVNPHLTDWRQIVAEGQRLARISPNFVIKVGVGEAGLRAVRALAGEGVRTNVTLVFSAAQAWLAARSGATYVSPFLGWKDAHGDDPSLLVAQIGQIFSRHAYPTQIIAAAVRNGRQVADAALAGAHCVTASFEVYRESFRNPYTDMGTALFGAAWDETRMGP
jgi:transaldolase